MLTYKDLLIEREAEVEELRAEVSRLDEENRALIAITTQCISGLSKEHDALRERVRDLECYVHETPTMAMMEERDALRAEVETLNRNAQAWYENRRFLLSQVDSTSRERNEAQAKLARAVEALRWIESGSSRPHTDSDGRQRLIYDPQYWASQALRELEDGDE